MLNSINIWERLVLFVSMSKRDHDKIDHDFTVDGHLDSSFAINQESARKDVARGFGVLKLKFQILSNPIKLHYQDNIYFVVMAMILMHNMIVEARLQKDEVEDG
ncbi:hypothetical protein ACHAW6_000637, partial [Cyclotella cf. meneghiniana]